MKVEENGWPTQPPARSYEKQAEVLELMVRAVHDFRGTYNVTDYRWFNLRDGDTASPLLFQHFGLIESDYEPKPAFDVYRRLVARAGSAAGRRRCALRLRLRGARGRPGAASAAGCAAAVAGADRPLAAASACSSAAAAGCGRDRHAAARRDRAPPATGAAPPPPRGRRVRLPDGRLVRLSRRFRACARRR